MATVSFIKSQRNMNGKIYCEECVTCHLMPIIEENHADGDCTFWPDMASCKHAKAATELFDEKMLFQGTSFFCKTGAAADEKDQKVLART